MDRLAIPLPDETTKAWAATPAKIINAPEFIAKRNTIFTLAARASAYHIGRSAETGESFAVLVAPAWWYIEVAPLIDTTTFDAWNGSERFIFWHSTADVKDLLTMIGWVCEECEEAVSDLVYDRDPYQKDVWGKDETRLLCRPCIQRIGEDI